MRDANEEALNSYLNKQEQYEIAEENFLNGIEDQVLEIQKLIDDLRVYTKQQDYDFSEVLEEVLRDL